MAVGQRSHFFAAGAQVVRRTPLGDQQGQHLTQCQPACLCIDVAAATWIEQAIEFAEVGTKPQPQTISDAMHFAMPGRCRKRHAVEVIAHDALACGERLRTFAVGSHAGGHHLPDLLLWVASAAFRRMAVFLHLGGQGTATSGLTAQAKTLFQLADRRFGKARPIHRRVGVGAADIQQAAILDEQQAHDDQWWDVLETLVILARIAVGVELNTAAIVDCQPSLRFFRVRREEAAVGVIQQRPRKTRLFLDAKIALRQLFDEAWKVDVSQPAVKWAVFGELDARARAQLDDKIQVSRIAA